MKTEDIISKLNEDWRQLLSIYPELTEDGKKQAKSAINEIVSSLKSMRDEKEEKHGLSVVEINELQKIFDSYWEQMLKINPDLTDENKIVAHNEWIICQYNIKEHFNFQSSPQPQPGRGAEEILKTHLNEYIKTVHATEMISLVGLNILMSKPYIKHILKAMEEYRTQSEGKIYPKWISVNERLPEESCTVLVVTSQNKVGEMWFSSEYKWHVLKDFATVTHWMPLPEPPKSLVK